MGVGGFNPPPNRRPSEPKKKPLRFGTGGADLKFDQNPRGAREAITTTAAEEIRPEEKLIVVARKFISGQQEGPGESWCQAGSLTNLDTTHLSCQGSLPQRVPW